MGKNWISGAIRHPGALTKKAKKAGESPMGFAREHASDPGTTGKQARLALTLRGFHSHMPKGATLSPKGDLGAFRQMEAESVGGFKDGPIVRASSAIPASRRRKGSAE